MTISHEYAEELGRQIDELEAENERLREFSTWVGGIRRSTLTECAKLVNEFDCHLAGYPNDEAKDYYESGVADACNMLEERIIALATQPPSAPVETGGVPRALQDLELFLGEVDGSEAAEGGTIDGTEAIAALDIIRAAVSRSSAGTGGLTPDLMNATTVSCTGLEITIACNDHDTKDALMDVLSCGDAADNVEAALRDAFPHFQDGSPITPEAIRGIGKEYLDMVMSWEPHKDEIEFFDHKGTVRKLVYEPGDYEVGINPGWVLEDDTLDEPQAAQEK